MPEKHPNTHRWGGPGASHEDRAEKPAKTERYAVEDGRRRSTISGGGGERDDHHSRDPETKGERGGPNRS